MGMKKGIRKRIIAWMLSIVVALLMMPCTSFEVDAEESIWWVQDIVHWTNGSPQHKVDDGG